MFGKERLRQEIAQIRRIVECTHNDVIKILKLLALKEIDFVQLGGSMNNQIQAGQTGQFSAVLTPTNGAMASGTFPKWAASDPAISLTPAADGLSCAVVVPPTQTANFDLSISAVSSDATVGTVTASHLITVTQPVPPALKSIDFVQTA